MSGPNVLAEDRIIPTARAGDGSPSTALRTVLDVSASDAGAVLVLQQTIRDLQHKIEESQQQQIEGIIIQACKGTTTTARI